MEHLNKFKQYLLQGKDRHSKITVKNYLADIRKFIFWYEKTFNREFNPWLVTKQIASQYKTALSSNPQSQVASARSLKRYFSSLRKFYQYLQSQNFIQTNPFAITPEIITQLADPWHIKEFSNYLILSHASKPTLKNYLADVRQFKEWFEQVITRQEDIQNATTLFKNITSTTIEEYKKRLLYDAKLSAVSINRKLSSLRKYFAWIMDKGFIKQQPIFNQLSELGKESTAINTSESIHLENLSLSEPNNLPTKQPQQYSKFPPFRLVQKLIIGSNRIFDLLIIAPIVSVLMAIKYKSWKMRGKKVFAPTEQVFNLPSSIKPPKVRLISTTLDSFVTNQQTAALKTISNLPKSLYAPLEISTKNFSWKKKIIFHLRHSRPKWYKKYHSYPFVHYLHFAIFLIYVTMVGLSVYQAWTDSPNFHSAALASLPASPPRMLAFKGTLLDSSGNPLTAVQTLRFGLYNNQTASGSALLWEETQDITPDAQGNFSTHLGKNQPLYQSLINDNPSLYIGVTVGRQPELAPRQQIATTAYTKDAERLQGLLPITDPNAGTSNIILALNSSGDLTIGGTASPKFEATGGEFTLSGQLLTLTTAAGSNTNIQLKPDGKGIIDAQKPIQNTTNYGMIPDLAGAVQFADSVGIMADSSSHSALLINQNSTGDLISASGSGIAKFTVNYVGAGTFANDLTVNGNNLNSNSPTFNLLNQNVLSLNLANQASSINIGSASGTTTINNSLKAQGQIIANAGLIVPNSQKLTFSGLTPGGINFIDNNKQFAQDPTNLFWDQADQHLGLGTNTPAFRLDVHDSQSSGAVAQIYNTNISSTARGLDIMLGSSNPGPTNSFIRFLNGNGNVLGEITGSSSASIAYKTNNADYAEYYKKADLFESFEPGDVVCLNNLGVTKCQNTSSLLGVISATAGFVGNGSHDNDPSYVLVGTVGQLPVKITSGANIQNGDPVTLSQGKLVKATGPGIILGHALASTNNQTSLLPIALNVTWYDTNANLSDAGNIKTWEASQPQIATNQPLKDYIASLVAQTINNLPLPSAPIVSPLAKVDQIATNVISPLADNSTVALQFAKDKVQILNTQTATASAVATIDNQGNASFAGDLAARDASLSGTLRVKKIIADEIEGSTPASPAANYITNITNVYNAIASPSAPTNTSVLAANSQLSNFPHFDQGLIAGASSFTDLAIVNTLHVGDSMSLSGTAINTIGTDLSLQPLRQGNLSLMGDLVKIDTQGNLSVAGNATFAQDLQVKGILAANILSPIPDQDLLIRLPTNDNGKESKLEVQTATGSGVLSINQLGNLISSGSANFMDITTKAFTIVRGAQADTSFTQTVTDASAGTAVISAYETERTISSPYVKPDSLIYITATSDTQGVTPYIARQTNNSFTIQIPHSVTKDIKINWWVVN